jgi:hypothetical protein
MLDSNADVWKDNILTLIIQNDSMHEAGNYNGVRKINFSILENMTVKHMTVPYMMKMKF